MKGLKTFRSITLLGVLTSLASALLFQNSLPSEARPPEVVSSRPGSLDESFGTGGFATSFGGLSFGRDTVIQPDGKIVAVGSNQQQPGFHVARHHTNGSLDSSFDTDGEVVTPIGIVTSGARAVALQTNGKIVVAGSMGIARPSGLDYDFAVVRYTTAGSLDPSFDADGIVTTTFTNTQDTAVDLAVQSDGKIIVAGYSFENSQFAGIFSRYDSNGLLDPTFDGDGKLTLSGGDCLIPDAIALTTDDKMIVAGHSCTANPADIKLFRFLPNGTLDATFDDDGKVTTSIGPLDDIPRAIALQADGKIVLSGLTQLGSNESDIAVLRHNSNGTLDNSFDSDGIVTTRVAAFQDGHSVTIQGDGKIVVAGLVRPGNPPESGILARYSAYGSPDLSFGTQGTMITSIGLEGSFEAVGLQADGKIVAVGRIWNGSSQSILAARFFGRTSPFDFDGDGKSDISIYRPSNGQWWLDRSTAGLIVNTFGNTTDTLAPGDFSGDGAADVSIFRPSTGEWFILRSEDSTYYSYPFGANGDVPVPGDYDGDGKTDSAVFRPSNSIWYFNRSSGGTAIETFGAAGDRPVPADYDGDGRADIAIYRPSEGQWWLNRSTAGVIVYTFGNSSDRNVPGDYTGDGKADVAIWRPSTGEWYILRSEDASFYSFPFGNSTDLPVPGDYDGDGKTDAGVFRPSSGTWYLNRSTSGTLIQGFGVASDMPIPNAFVR